MTTIDDSILYSMRGPKSMYEMTWAEVADFLKTADAVIVPIGQVAQHGRHMPLSSDVIQARELCRRIVTRLQQRGHQLLLGPTIPFGHSPTHHEFAGTVQVEPETLASVIRDIGHSLWVQGFRNIVLLCCGGGNWAGVENAAYRLWKENGAPVFVLGYFETMALAARPILESPKRGLLDGHAGELETSVVLAATPELVDLTKAENVQSDAYRELMALPFEGFNMNELARAAGVWSLKDFSEQGVVGDATVATADKGDRLLDAAAEALTLHLAAVLFNRRQGEKRT